MEPSVKKEVNNDSAYYTIHWSKLKKADKYEIISNVPSVAGIFELYYEDKKKKLNLFFLSKAWYGGLRYTLRKRTDPEMENNPNRRKILNDFDCYYRYTLTESYKDMSDILFFFAKTYFPGNSRIKTSGRYQNIFVKEISDDKIVTI